MAATICPTILAENPHTFREQMERVESFANRIHIDVADGVFAPNQTIGFDRLWWDANKFVDLHVMYKKPFEHTKAILGLRPRLVIVHAEAEGDFVNFADHLHLHGIEVGVALLPQTSVDHIKPALESIDHVLIFSGDLGYFGGQANLSLLSKVKQLRGLKPTLEIGWDGGVNDQNARQIAEGGVDVLNVGGFIQRSQTPLESYKLLTSRIER